MNQSTSDTLIAAISLDRTGAEPLHAQLAHHLRRLILERGLAPGARLPSSRGLAEELSVSRATVVAAVDQLVSEGYAEGRRGSGVFVAADLPEESLQARPSAPVRVDGPPAPPRRVRPFQAASPDLAAFPHRDWARLFDRVWRDPEPELLANPDPLGWAPLRHAIAGHLRLWRGIDCAPAQVVVTSGAAEAATLLARVAFRPGDTVLMEEPGYRVLREGLALNGLAPCPVPVDADGFDLGRGLATAPSARGAVVTPARHYPLGMTLPLARRLALLDWAEQTGGLIVEDDYDSEYRYQGSPLPALMSLDRGGRTAWLGSFSKVLMPSLRLGVLVVPRRLTEAVRTAMAGTGPSASLIAQPVLARFIESGDFASHIRRMRRLYARRQKALVTALGRDLDGLLHAAPEPAGMHLVARLTPALSARMDDAEAARRAAEAGVIVAPLSSYYAGKPLGQGLILGYAGHDETAIADAALRLGRALRG